MFCTVSNRLVGIIVRGKYGIIMNEFGDDSVEFGNNGCDGGGGG